MGGAEDEGLEDGAGDRGEAAAVAGVARRAFAGFGYGEGSGCGGAGW